MRRQRGFILVLVLAILVILSVVASSVAVTAGRLGEQEQERLRAMQSELDMADTRAGVLYLLLTQRRTFGGLTVDARVVLNDDEMRAQQGGDDVLSLMPVGNEIPLDSTPHRGVGTVDFALQDDRGRLPVNWAPAPLLERFAASANAGSVQVGTLLNLLQDYQDEDDLHRLNSAERDAYRAAGRPPPSNRALVTPLELRRVMGWDRVVERFDDARLLDVVTTVRSAQLNVNTAPGDVLEVLPGVDATVARRLIDARSMRPFVNMSDVYQVIGGVPANDEYLSLYSMDSGTLKLWSPQGGLARVLHWTLTPFDRGGRPWREDYEFALPDDARPDEGVVRTSAAAVFARAEDPPE
jgi:type II secretory pathway component PulK